MTDRAKDTAPWTSMDPLIVRSVAVHAVARPAGGLHPVIQWQFQRVCTMDQRGGRPERHATNATGWSVMDGALW